MAGTLTASVIKNDTTSPPQFQNSAGTEIGTLCRAWVQFTGSTATIAASFNVSSITRHGTGDYTVNFANAMTDANYAISISGQGPGPGSLGFNSAPFCSIASNALQSPTTGGFRFSTWPYNWASPFDPAIVCTSVFR